jgi:hypothetical protein
MLVRERVAMTQQTQPNGRVALPGIGWPMTELADYLRDHVAHDPQHCGYFTVWKTSVIR